jgi:hypothetical protein
MSVRNLRTATLRQLVAYGAMLGVLTACGGEGEVYRNLRIYHNPYAEVNWESDVRIKAQHHDHVAVNSTLLQAYDAAGYNAVSLMDYSGNPALPYAWRERIWPPEKWIPQTFLAKLSNVRILIPNAEEVVDETTHVTSPFLTTYVERLLPGQAKQPWHYESAVELFDLIRNGGGLPCIAHPWEPGKSFGEFSGTFCIEIYSAFAEARKRQGDAGFLRDRNEIMVQNWDRVLDINQSVLAIAVNDHFGPGTREFAPPEVLDSGKIVVLARSATLEDYQDAVLRGAFFGAKKDSFPIVHSIAVEHSAVFIDTPGTVRWISGGRPIHEGSLLEYSKLPPNSRYVRAEITQGDAVVYTQAFWVRPVGDVDGNYRVDSEDIRLCAAIEDGVEAEPDHVAACEALALPF